MLTIIVTVYNVSKYLQNCLESIKDQTYQNIEVILIDDGSTDDSGKICDDFCKRDARFQVIHQKNMGLVKSRKVGALHAAGDMIAYIDGDDWIDAHMYENMMMELLKHPQSDMVTSGLIYEWSHKNKVLLDHIDPGTYCGEEIEKTILPGLIFNPKTSKQNITTSLCNKLIRTSFMREIAVNIDDRLTLGEDGAAMCFLMDRVNQITVMSQAWYHYRQHDNSMIQNKDFGAFEQISLLERCLRGGLETKTLKKISSQQIDYYLKSFLKNVIHSIYQVNMDTGIYLFPFELVPTGSRIILYGAGNVGKAYWKCLQQADGIDVTAWVDKNSKNLTDYDSYEIASIDEALKKEYDYIVIAILDEQIKDEIITELCKKGVSAEQIIWKKSQWIR